MHAFNQFLTLLSWYSLPLHLNPFPQFMGSIGKVFMLCKTSLETTPEMFNRIQVWRLCRPNHCPEFLLIQPALDQPAGMLRVIILLKDDVRRIETKILQGLLELILQNLEIEVPIHPTINLASKANSPTS